jgi:hypothetical protein
VGLGRRTFAPGEVLTASNVMNYLQDQAVMNFAGTAARGSAIGTALSEGMVSYLNDTDNLEVYRAIGTAAPDWNPVAFRSELITPGMIPIVPSSVNVGSGTATVGATGKVTFTTVGTNISLNGVFTSQFDYYKIIFRALPTTGGSVMAFRMRAAGTDASTGIYHNQGTIVTGGSSATINNNSLTSLNFIVGHANVTSQATFDITNPFNTTQTNFNCISNGWNGSQQTSIIFGGYVGSTVSYDGISFILASTTSTGTLQVFGYN